MQKLPKSLYLSNRHLCNKFLLAADIIGTAISLSWDAVAKLAAITGIRTFLNFFLQREVGKLFLKLQKFYRAKEKLTK
ncbi:MAG: DUF1622 domain-containing protein [Nostoc sp.]|uniref:DUF1622 domain-containing protein n=1 Tax=Nostoc sp. TaxID=1180 RepID=UPI002FFAD910